MRIGSATFLWVALATVMLSPSVHALVPSDAELARARHWAAVCLEGVTDDQPQDDGMLAVVRAGELPFSFVYGDRSSRDLLKTWKIERTTKRLDEHRTEYTTVFRDPETGLEVRCVGVEYHDFPTVEWTLYFKHNGSEDSPLLQDIRALDISLKRGPIFDPLDTYATIDDVPLDIRLELLRRPSDEFVLHHWRGTPCSMRDYEPFETVLGKNATKMISAAGGRPTNSDLSYFNLQCGNNGLLVVVGWPGQWSTTFTRDQDTGLHITAGQERTHLRLHPGEEIRTPLMVLQFWNGDWIRAQNIWRRWMLAHNLPRRGGKPLTPMTGGYDGYYFPELLINEKDERRSIDRYVQQGLQLDYWWIDAGWYVNNGTWMNTGTWEVDRARFPNGLRGVTDYARAMGIPRSIVWFEPERATWPSWIHEHHPNWLLGETTQWQVVNLGDPECRTWVTDHLSKLFAEERIDAYRQDFNLDPLPQWQANDSAERQGITEIKHVMGYLAFWDELLRRHPDLLIDSCASGGRRNDLETLRRAVPLWRSDWAYDPLSMQCLTYGISFWMPYFGTGVGHASGSDCHPYTLRSDVAPFVLWAWDMHRPDLDFDLLRTWMSQWRSIAPNYLGDYYPLTSYSTSNDVWMAWQFDRPEVGEGMVQAFRRLGSPYETARFRLRGLDANARYTLNDLDSHTDSTATGAELMNQGLELILKEQPAAAIVVYQKLK